MANLKLNRSKRIIRATRCNFWPCRIWRFCEIIETLL